MSGRWPSSNSASKVEPITCTMRPRFAAAEIMGIVSPLSRKRLGNQETQVVCTMGQVHAGPLLTGHLTEQGRWMKRSLMPAKPLDGLAKSLHRRGLVAAGGGNGFVQRAATRIKLAGGEDLVAHLLADGFSHQPHQGRQQERHARVAVERESQPLRQVSATLGQVPVAGLLVAASQ